ncbi:MAG: hypothetical protein LAN37_09520 [Acidobacteriia bacterium]|nr:hypothetical protein [Terriglobia bacterium]
MALAITLGFVIAASGALPDWVINIEAKTAVENAFFRLMAMPGGAVLGRRPPSETRPALADLIKSQPNKAELYSLRALEDEQALDFDSAEAAWKQYAQKAQDKGAANLTLADFYHRRVRPADEIRTLAVVGQMPAPASESLTPTAQQRSWKAFERSLQVAQTHALPKDVSAAQYKGWMARYPQERSVFIRYFQFLLEQKDGPGAQQAIAEYQKAFPDDTVFPVKAKALLNYKEGSVEQGLAVYDQAFQPLWPAELVQNFFELLKETRSTRKYGDKWRAQLDADPDDINALARIFFYYQQQGKLDVAQRTIDEYRLRKEERKGKWSADELYTLARLLEQVHAYTEASRYYYALYNAQGPDAQEKALAGLTSILLTAPEQPLRLGAGEISIYQDIATLDQGPGFLNGILSLILNTTNPAYKFSQEEQRAVPYFHRAKAAELLVRFDQAYPASKRRPELHAQLIEMYANYGASEAVIREGKQFLGDFADAPQRTQVALLMADAYSRTTQTKEEFAIYDAVLLELAKRAQQVPLGAATAERVYEGMPAEQPGAVEEQGLPAGEAAECEEGCEQGQAPARIPKKPRQKAFAVGENATEAQGGPRSPEYARVLERYIGRLVAEKQVPQALAILRREIDRNPNDPGLYERLAAFLQQNQIGAETEQVYKRAIQQFQDRSWYHKLARWYLAQKRKSDFEQLSSEVVRIFAGTDLQSYFESVVREADFQVGPQMYLKLNQYAHQRFPHNLTFVRNLLNAYSRKETRDAAAHERLLREHWMEADDLRNWFFRLLSGAKLENELQQAEKDLNVAGGKWDDAAKTNPVETRFVAEAELWRSHFEDAAAPLGAIARVFPADFEMGRRASSVYRSLAYFDARNTDLAIEVEQNMLKADPGNRDTLARIGDIYADRELFAKAAPYWNRMPELEPGNQGGYLDAATIFWDYFDFDNALRLLNDGRTKLGRPGMYAYEEGAIYEGKREYPQAIAEYMKGALAQEGYSPAQNRLLQLATRPKYRDLVEEATVKPTTPVNPPTEAINLRIAVLEAQARKDDLEKFLMGLVERATALELVENVETLAQQKSLESVRQRALERQAELTTDPIRRLELRYALVRFYEGKKDFAAAQRNVEALYSEHPKILGVVRATVDFFWRMKQQQRAIDVLVQASKDAYPDLAKRFRFEAARKMTEAGQYEQARQIIVPLMDAEPYNSEYLAAMADTFARASDDQGLKKFYLEKITFFQNAPIEAGFKTGQIAGLRRALIPALTRLKDYTGAVDQYMLIINNYPEDEGLVTEAAFYAGRYDLKQRLLDFYARTVQQSPRDVRWAVVLARLQANFEDYPAAIDAYTKAVAVRPDRTDLRTARAGLLERLMRFDEAASDYEKLYELQYKDPKWMEKIAEVRARQGKTAEVVQALELALIEGRPEQAQNYFNVAERLERWGMLAQARDFADQGMKASGDSVLGEYQNHSGAQLWIRILTRQRKQDEAWKRLDGIVRSVSAGVDAVLAKPAIPNSDEDALKRATETTRRNAARAGMAASLREMGVTIEKYFAPEEREQFATYLAQKRTGTNSQDLNDFLVAAAQAAGIPELEARWRYELMQAAPDVAQGHMMRVSELQAKRLKFKELGIFIESMAARVPQFKRGMYTQKAVEAYRAGEDWQAELRVLTAMHSQNALGGNVQRYYELLLAHDPQTLVALAAKANPGERDASANYIVANGDSRTAQLAVGARGQGLPSVWVRAYLGLVGLYFRDASPNVDTAFRSALGESTIGERLGKPVDRTQQLAGDIWFYFGGRYGEYLGSVTRKENAEDYLPASLEQTPGRSAAYETLAEYYNEAGDAPRAIADYRHALELGGERADIHDKLAVIHWKQNNRAEAKAQWRESLAILTRQVKRRQVPETFWRDFGSVMEHLGSRKIFGEFRADVDAVLRAYLGKNGTWRNSALLRDAYKALGNDAAGVAWLLDLASVAPNPTAVVTEFVNDRWIPATYKEPIYQRVLRYKQDALSRSQGLEHDYAQQEAFHWRYLWISYLIDLKQYDRANRELEQITKSEEAGHNVEWLRLEVASALGTLDARLNEYRADPELAPPLDTLRQVASKLQDKKDKASARKILEYVFTREIQEHTLTSANLLGLAEIRLDSGDIKGALDLLHRATLVIGQPFENLDAAASLLIKTGHPAEATEFLEALVKAQPWNADARVRLAQAQIKANKDAVGARAALVAIARSPMEMPYATRLAAAAAAAPSTERIWGSNELRIIGSGAPVSAADASHAFFYEARLKAAKETTSLAVRMQLLRAAVEDFPNRDAARIPLFRAALEAKQDQLAIAALSPVMENVYSLLAARNRAEAQEEDETSGAPSTYYEFTLGKIPVSGRASIAAGIGSAMDALNRWPEAMRFLSAAVRLESAPEKKAALQKQIADLRARMRRHAQNEARRPMIHPALEQDRVVRPMVAARAAPPGPVAPIARRTP